MSPFWSISLFWIATLVFVGVALVLVLRPLLKHRSAAARISRRDSNIAVYRDQLKELEADRNDGSMAPDQFESAKRELEARLAEDALVATEDTALVAQADHRWIWALGGLIPLAAFGLYFWFGNPNAFMGGPMGNPQTASAEAGMPQEGAAGGNPAHAGAGAFIKQLEDKVKAEPNNGQAQADLGFGYAMTGRFPESFKAYTEAARLLPNDAKILSAYAEVMAIVHGDNLDGKPMELLNKALAIDPNEVRALLLSGQYAMVLKQYDKAAALWDRAAKALPAEDPTRQKVMDSAQEARRLAKGGAPVAQLDNLANQSAAAAPAAAAGNGRINGRVELSAALKGKAGAGDRLYILARGAAGGAPLAAFKGQVDQLPMSFELTDAMAMMPGVNLSSQQEVTLVARISKSGQPQAQPGDLEGTLKAVKVGAQGVKIVIDSVR